MSETSLNAFRAQLQLALQRPPEEQLKIYEEISKYRQVLTETHQYLHQVIDELKEMKWTNQK